MISPLKGQGLETDCAGSGGITMPGTIQSTDAALGFSCGCGSAGLVVDIPSLLQPKWFCDPIKSKM